MQLPIEEAISNTHSKIGNPIMPIQLQDRKGGVLEVTLSGTIVAEDYLTFVPIVDELVKQHDGIRMLVIMRNFHGWTPSATWEDTKFAIHHYRAIRRLAVVAERNGRHG
jgi:hypothetical protein